MLPIKQTLRSHFTDAIKQPDKKLLRKLICEEQAELSISINYHQIKILLKIAVESHDALFVQRVVDFTPNLNSVNGASILWMVVEDHDTEIASILVRAGADVNIPQPENSLQLSFLHVLAASESPEKFELAKLMMDYGADVLAQDVDKFTVLDYSVRCNNFALASELLKRDAVFGEYVVNMAVLSSKTEEWLKFFLENCVEDGMSRNEIVSDIFIRLCQLDYNEEKIAIYLKTLLKLGVPETFAIFHTIWYRNSYLVKTMLDADIDHTTKMLLLHPAVSLASSDMASMLINWGADIQYSMDIQVPEFTKGCYPIHVACAYGSLANVKLLLNLEADINITDDEGNTPFSFTEQFHPHSSELNKELIKHIALLASKNVNINEIDMEIIKNNPDYSKFFEDCSKELENMKQLKILNTVDFYSVFTKDIKELSLLMRREKFVKNYVYRLSTGSFPLYSNDMDVLFKRAKNRKKSLSKVESVVYECLGKILPVIVIESILVFLYYSDVCIEILDF